MVRFAFALVDAAQPVLNHMISEYVPAAYQGKRVATVTAQLLSGRSAMVS